jgi:hypothetical protein
VVLCGHGNVAGVTGLSSRDPIFVLHAPHACLIGPSAVMIRLVPPTSLVSSYYSCAMEEWSSHRYGFIVELWMVFDLSCF